MTATSNLVQERRAIETDPMRPRLCRVEESRRETHDTFTLLLKPLEGDTMPRFAPGQFNMLYAIGAGECAISISGDPASPQALLHTTRVVGTVTRSLQRLKPGDVLGVRGPFGSAWPIERAEGRDIVLLAGGIGLAPLRPALYAVLAEREKYRNVVVLYGARTPQDILFRRELEKWSARLDVQVHVSVDRAAPGWHGNVGVVTRLIQRAPFDRLHSVTLVCGPEVMMRFAIMELRKRGVPDESIHVSMERNMKCAIGFCGHCQFGPAFICKDGPVFCYHDIRNWFDQREL